MAIPGSFKNSTRPEFTPATLLLINSIKNGSQSTMDVAQVGFEPMLSAPWSVRLFCHDDESVKKTP